LAQPANGRPAQRQAAVLESPDAPQTKAQLDAVLQGYPPAIREVLRWDPNLLSNEAYLAGYPALANFLNSHPEIARNPSFYVGEPRNPSDYVGDPRSRAEYQTTRAWETMLGFMAALIAASLLAGFLIWIIRSLIDYKRWSRLARAQTEVHTKLMDRFNANEDLLAYVKSPAGSKFLESSPIALDAPQRGFGAPLARIFRSLQAGLVLVAGGIGLLAVRSQESNPISEPLRAFGIVAIALGLGFVISAIISFLLSRRLGLLEPASEAARTQLPVVQDRN
jgi:hypothetical protein